MADAVLAIKIVTDYAQGQKGLAAAESGVGRLQKGLGKMVAPAAVAVGAIALFGKSAVDSASRVEQAIGAVDSVFGKNSGQVKKWAAGAAESVGLAKSEYMELASVMGAQLKNMGVPLDQVAGKTNDLVTLGADLAATYGGTTKEAVEALGSAMRGETDPIERYGVSIKQADIAAKMAADGTDKLTGKQAKQAKSAALLALMTQQTADAQGQFAEENDTAAVQAQITAAKYEDMKATLGTALLPAITAVTSILGKMIDFMAKHKTATTVAIVAIAALAVGILALNVALGIYTAVTTLAASTTLMAWVAVAWPILAVVAAVALLVVGIVILWKKSSTFRAVVLGTWAAIKSAAQAAARVVKVVWSATWRAISSAGRAMGAAVRAVFNAVRGAISAVVSAVARLIGRIRSIRVPGVIRSAFSAIRDTIGNVISRVGDLISKLRGITVPGAVKSALNAIKDAANAVVTAIQNIINKLQSIPTPHINWPSPPKWLGKVIPGGLLAPAPPVAPGPAPLGRYVAPTGRSGRLTGRAVATGSSGPTIVVQGALDPEAVARQIQRLLGGHTRRMGGAAA
jgi:hypothetical protein